MQMRKWRWRWLRDENFAPIVPVLPVCPTGALQAVTVLRPLGRIPAGHHPRREGPAFTTSRAATRAAPSLLQHYRREARITHVLFITSRGLAGLPYPAWLLTGSGEP